LPFATRSFDQSSSNPRWPLLLVNVMVLAWQFDVLCTFAAAFKLTLPECEANAPKANQDDLCTLADSWNITLSICESGQIGTNSSSTASSLTGTITSTIASDVSSTSTAISTTSGDDNSTISVTETAPAVSTATGTVSAVPPPADVTSSGADPSATPPSSANATAPVVEGATVGSTILILLRTNDNAYSVTSGLDAYGIPYELARVPQTGFQLPTLNTSAHGNYGGIISLSELAYEYPEGWHSGISADQYNSIYAYQVAFGVRFTRIDAYPQPAFGTTTAPQGVGCCSADVEQLISLTNNTGFSTANIKTDAFMSTKNMYHYPAVITDSATTWEVAKYSPSDDGAFTDDTTAAVINDFGGRQQMVWFGSWATEWSPTSNFLQHAYIHWMTRGLFLGARKTYLSTQIDDVHLTTAMYSPADKRYRLIPEDLVNHVAWTKDINGRMPAGSDYFIELGHNGNGDIISAVTGDTGCDPNNAIYYDYPPSTDLEFQKPLNTGVDLWPTTPSSYSWSLACAKYDELANWFTTAENRDAFAHVSHTFTHLPQNNITYSDAEKEITFNQAWLKQIGIDQGDKFSPKSLIPPAITGLHNGDAIRAWITNGITSAVGDNSRPVLLSSNQHWPLTTTTSGNGYAGLTIVPRWPTTIYWNCDLPDCTLQEWKDTASGKGTFADLLTFERTTASRYLLGLRHDGYMFHQANLRQNDVDSMTVGSQTGKLSLLQAWTETIVQEMTRLTDWPILAQKQDDLAVKFNDRMARDQCQPKLEYTHSTDGKSIVAVTVTANSNSCGTTIPVTLPGGAPTTSGKATADKVGSEPLIMWVTMSGSAVKLNLPKPISLSA
jgi:hypothetical protein